VTKALLFSKAFTSDELGVIKDDCKARILSGKGQLAFVSSTGAGGRTASMLQNYTADELLEIVIEALEIVAGTSSGAGISYMRFGGIY
jgi:hypothetical protein